MKLESIFELPFQLSSVNYFVSGEFPLTPEQKVEGFSNLAAGWRNGSGEAISASAIRGALDLLRAVRSAGLVFVDAFPSADGGVTVAIYPGKRDFSFHVKPNGKVKVESESIDLPIIEDLSLSHALWLIQNLSRWNFSSSLTLPITIKHTGGFVAHHSRTPATVRVFRSSIGNVWKEPLVRFATTPVASTAA